MSMKLHHRVDGPAGAPLLVLGPSLGTTLDIWEPQLSALTETWRVLRYDLPGHGGSAPAASGLTIDDLARAVLDLVDDELADDDEFAVGGISLGGAIATAIAAGEQAGEQPKQQATRRTGERASGPRRRVRSLVLCCTSARFGEPGPWLERAALVRASGVAQLAPALAARWFTAGYDGRWVTDMLDGVDAESYAACCEALASCDLIGRLPAITAPTLIVAGADDPATPLGQALTLAQGIPGALLRVVPGAAHLASVERADAVTPAIVQHLGGDSSHAAGMRTRREVLGDAHVDRAVAATTGFTRDFQHLITRYAWDEIWNRPGLDRRTRSCVTLTALVARGHLDELAMHVRAALRNGLTPDEIGEVLLQTAIYCGVPAANAAFAVAQRVLTEEA
ncbi:bifunctional 3-oxoadipate enol-lactonase/4-carboxymuconolactone decarboxylase PcaDC [Nonomuraea guangzhouensis]|uniref:4-carboxymuconolactone decarboxylase n=1 Tax=Nonomuraea guangzhouensis TaxID=1291555 RepID=A0ABW4GUF8_9ACTN|nr:4-carboxymuconolactone decarboxylase [Nonomuraea guangzhouensis]